MHGLGSGPGGRERALLGDHGGWARTTPRLARAGALHRRALLPLHAHERLGAPGVRSFQAGAGRRAHGPEAVPEPRGQTPPGRGRRFGLSGAGGAAAGLRGAGLCDGRCAAEARRSEVAHVQGGQGAHRSGAPPPAGGHRAAAARAAASGLALRRALGARGAGRQAVRSADVRHQQRHGVAGPPAARPLSAGESREHRSPRARCQQWLGAGLHEVVASGVLAATGAGHRVGCGPGLCRGCLRGHAGRPARPQRSVPMQATGLLAGVNVVGLDPTLAAQGAPRRLVHLGPASSRRRVVAGGTGSWRPWREG
mmetsp:Transcript_60649/g.198452  ORF Transcript_60649/g.198452 Transcript_60649/m.198452 type:complete len:310 (+) Transcript_60649:2513-3442(+)